MKDAFKRFCKNKSSVVAACILGILLVFSFTLPYIIPYDTTVNHPEASFLEPKLFNAGTGFWDGTKRVNDAVCSTVKVSEETNLIIKIQLETIIIIQVVMNLEQL